MSRARMAGRVNVAGPSPAAEAERGRAGALPPWSGLATAVLGAVLLGYFVWLVVSPNDDYSVPIDGWLVDGIDVSGGVLCLVRAFSRRGQDRVIVLVLAASLFAWASGDIALTFQSLGGATPPDSAVGTRRVLPFVLPPRLRGLGPVPPQRGARAQPG